MLKENLQNTISDRFELMKVIGDSIKTKTEEIKDVVDKVKSLKAGNSDLKPSDVSKELKSFRLNQTEIILLNETIKSISVRVAELYKVAKISGMEVDLDERDKSFIENFLSKNKIDLFGVEKGKLIMLDDKYHTLMKENMDKTQKNLEQDILNHIISLK